LFVGFGGVLLRTTWLPEVTPSRSQSLYDFSLYLPKTIHIASQKQTYTISHYKLSFWAAASALWALAAAQNIPLHPEDF
jgi:hypothetical protein